MASYDSGSKGSTKIESTSRDVGGGKAPGVPSTVRGGPPGLRTQEEIGGKLGTTENDR